MTLTAACGADPAEDDGTAGPISTSGAHGTGPSGDEDPGSPEGSTSGADASTGRSPGSEGGSTGHSGDETSGGGGGGPHHEPWFGEPDCETLPGLSDIAASFSADDIPGATLAICERRYLPGIAPVQECDKIDLFSNGVSNFDGLIRRIGSLIHECGHFWDLDHSPTGKKVYRLREDLVIETQRLSNFSRSELWSVHEFADDDDFFGPKYLEGQLGEMGFNFILEELTQYTHSLAPLYCLRDYTANPGATSTHVDGVLMQMYYLERYLFLARTEHPADYDAIVADPGHIEAIIALWDRAGYWLDKAEDYPEWGTDQALIHSYVYAPNNVAEIDMIRALR